MFFNIGILIFAALLFMAIMRMKFFSAILNFACVLTAMAIAFACIEPLFYSFLGKYLKDYAWGIGLAAVFCIACLLLRFAFIKAVPGNVFFLPTVGDAGALPFNIASVIAILGMLLFCLELTPLPAEIGGYRGWFVDTSGTLTRDNTSAGRLWFPVDSITANYLLPASLGPMYTDHSLATMYPNFAQYCNLFHESLNNGDSRQGMQPDMVTIKQLVKWNGITNPANYLRNEAKGVDTAVQAPGGQFDLYTTDLTFDNAAKDAGDRLRLTKAQVCMVVRVNQGGQFVSVPIYPNAFIEQFDPTLPDVARFVFDSGDLAACSLGGETAEVKMSFEFVVPYGSVPSHLIIRGLRVTIPPNMVSAPTQKPVADLEKLNIPGKVAPSPGKMTTSSQWIGYFAALLCAVLVIAPNLMEAKRTHQD